MIKVIHSSPVWLPQTQTWMYNQVKQLQRLGVQTHVVCEQTENLEQFTVANIHSLSSEPLFRQVWHKGLRKLGIRRQLNYLTKIGRYSGTQIIHSHFGDVGWANLGQVRKLNAKHVVTFYGVDVNNLPIQDPAWLERYAQLFDEVDRVLCEGPYMARSILELGCPKHKVKVQHIGVDLQNISFQPRQWQPGKPLRVLIAASFREKKGIPYALKALQIVARKIPVELSIIGDANQSPDSQKEKASILETLERSGLKENTRLLGYQSHKALLEEAYAHHLFLQPSISAQDGDTEGGAPVVIIEMLATGMPVIGTMHCDIPEVVGSAFSHLLAPERDAKKLAECILILLDDSGDWAVLMQDQRERIEREYNLQKQVKRLLIHYNKVL